MIKEIWKHRWDYPYLIPALAIMGLLIVWPFFETIRLAFYDTNSRNEETFVGMGNFAELYRNDTFWLVINNTLVWAIFGTIAPFLVGFLAALVANQKLPGLNFARGLMIIPFAMGFVPAAHAWRWILHGDYGVVSGTLQSMGLIKDSIPFMQSPSLIMPSLILINTWKSFPFVMVLIYSGLQTIPETLYKAARIDGASAWSQFWEITIPQMSNVILVTTMLQFIGNMNQFTLIEIMTGGGPAFLSEIIVTWIYHASFQTLRFGLASAASVLLFIVLMIFSVFYVRTLTRSQVQG